MSARWRAARLGLLALAGLAAALPRPAVADAIVGLGFVNESSPDALIDEPLRVREFATASSFGAAWADATSASFSHRMAWGSGHRVEPGLPFTVLSWSNKVAYDLTFTVEDPLLRGYTLDIDSLFRGYLTAQWNGVDAAVGAGVFSAGTLMTASLDSGGGFVPVTALATDIEVALANDTEPFVNLLVDAPRSFGAGHFAGTRSFTLRYASLVNNVSAALFNLNHGEVGVRFGLEPSSSRFQQVVYPGADGEAADQHGHFVTVTARYDAAAAPVPEPHAAALVGLGLALLGTARRRRPRT